MTSRATSACHSLAAERTSIAAPTVSDAKNVMMATTPMRAPPEMVERGTMGLAERRLGLTPPRLHPQRLPQSPLGQS